MDGLLLIHIKSDLIVGHGWPTIDPHQIRLNSRLCTGLYYVPLGCFVLLFHNVLKFILLLWVVGMRGGGVSWGNVF